MDSIVRFFDVSAGPELVNPMFGTPHLVAIGLLLLMAPVMLLTRGQLIEISPRGEIIRAMSLFILVDQLLLFALYFAYDYQPFWERFPLHLCAWLSLFVPLMTLLGRLDAVRFVGIWAMGSGTMAVLNMSLPYNPVTSYVFLHYVWMHLYLVALPIFLALHGEMQMTYTQFLRSMGGLLALSAAVFVVDWWTGANYMYIGPNSTLEVPFIPEALRAWPWSYPTFMLIGVILLHGFYVGVRALSARAPRAVSGT